MKKKILALCLVVVLAVTAVTGATLAYFTDTDADINVMVAGNVKIQQDEWQTNEAGTGYEEYENNKPLFPYTGPTNPDTGIASEYNGTVCYPKNDNQTGVNNSAFSTDNNAVDKIVTVKNKGNQPAYIRTLFAFELDKNGVNPAADDVNLLNYLKFDNGTGWKWTGVTIEVDGIKYAVAEYYYVFNKLTVDGVECASAIDAGKISFPSLMQLYLSPKAGNEWYDNYGEEYNLLVLSQAAQITGFDSAKDALDTAFAEVTAANAATVQAWFDSIAKEEGVSVDTVHPSVVDDKPATDGKVA